MVSPRETVARPAVPPAGMTAFLARRGVEVTGLGLVVIGLALRSGSIVVAAVAAVAIGFFHVKAAWEERRLAATYPGYADYARTTPRFVPRRRPTAHRPPRR